jgi:23S rRNA pseudouridine2605 synthase
MKTFLLAIASIVLFIQCLESAPMYEVDTYRPYVSTAYGYEGQYGQYDDRYGRSYGYGDRYDNEYGRERYGYDNDRYGGYGERRIYGYGDRYDNDRYGMSKSYGYGNQYDNDYGRERYGYDNDRYGGYGERRSYGYSDR